MNVVAVTGALIKQGDDFLLQLRDEKPSIQDSGLVSIWGGALEPGESPEQAAIRELYEELGISVDKSQLEYLGLCTLNGNQRDGGGPDAYDIHMYFLEIDPTVTTHCFEGQGIVRVKRLEEVEDGKASQALVRALAHYSQRSR